MEKLIEQALKDVGWPSHVYDESGVFQTLYSTPDLELNGYIHTHEDSGMIVFYTLNPDVADRQVRVMALEFVNWANWNVLNGNFEMHPIEGSIRFRTSVNSGTDQPTPGALRQMLIGNAATHLRYGLGLKRLLADGATLEDACAGIL